MSKYLKICREQDCWLRLPGCTNDSSTVVPCHSNQLKHGKGKGIKAKDEYTVPGCFTCHAELDSGKRMSKQERRDAWDSAYDRWSAYRMEEWGI